MFERAAEVLATGDGVVVAPVSKELTTQQAADVLGVSRQYLVRLLDAGRLPFTRTGTRRRVALHDVLALRAARTPVPAGPAHAGAPLPIAKRRYASNFLSNSSSLSHFLHDSPRARSRATTRAAQSRNTLGRFASFTHPSAVDEDAA